MNKFQVNRLLATLLLITFATSIGCSTWRPLPATDITPDDAAALKGKRVRFYTDDGVTFLKVERVEFPYVYGEFGGRNRVDLRQVHKIEIDREQAGTTILLVAGVAVVFVVLIAVATCDICFK